VLVTGFDIIFFWVARMMMMGLHFMDEVPFHTVYIHALVRDQQGQKMSKSKGNIIDPLVLIERYGADALRFTLAAMAVPGRDVRLAESRVEGYRNFATKLWNAARFCQMSEVALVPGFDPAACRQKLNRWIVSQVAATGRGLDEALAAYRLNDGANLLYHFSWHQFCDWYLEAAKPILGGTDQAAAAETRATAAWALGQILHLLHPFMPFITEELWEQLGGGANTRLVTARWPTYGEALIDAEVDTELDWVLRLISEVRSLRAEMNVPPGAWLELRVRDASEATLGRLGEYDEIIRRLARLKDIQRLDGEVPGGSVQILQREVAKAEGEIAKIQKKLANEQFLAKAPEAVIEEQKERQGEAVQTRDKLAAALERLAGA
jgi:valyl-tRNA synthetase